jgi:hypothetical protein
MRLRLRRAIRSPAGRKVVAALALYPNKPLRAVEIAALAGVNATSARDHAYRLVWLGYATRHEQPCPSNRRTVAAWQLTLTGYLYAKGES